MNAEPKTNCLTRRSGIYDFAERFRSRSSPSLGARKFVFRPEQKTPKEAERLARERAVVLEAWSGLLHVTRTDRETPAYREVLLNVSTAIRHTIQQAKALRAGDRPVRQMMCLPMLSGRSGLVAFAPA